MPPNEGIAKFQYHLDRIKAAIHGIDKEYIVVGNFNAKAVKCGMERPCSRGTAVSNMAVRLNLNILNSSMTMTFRHSRCEDTIINITLEFTGLTALIEEWLVLEKYTGSAIGKVNSESQGGLAQVAWQLAKFSRGTATLQSRTTRH